MIEIVPSILSADFARLADEVAKVEARGAGMLHVDVMDGHFVPNLAVGTPVLQSLRKVTRSVLDVHLMITDPDKYAPVFIKAGADQITVHQEVCPHLDRTLHMIREEGARAGVAINPSTPALLLDEVLPFLDHVLVMSVNPGFGGQHFLPHTLNKVRYLEQQRHERRLSFSIEIDGGITVETAADAARAGCDWLVAGSSIFGSPDPGAAYRDMQQAAREAAMVRV